LGAHPPWAAGDHQLLRLIKLVVLPKTGRPLGKRPNPESPGGLQIISLKWTQRKSAAAAVAEEQQQADRHAEAEVSANEKIPKKQEKKKSTLKYQF
jgi:hypothetical protein